jgi:dTMP kinase
MPGIFVTFEGTEGAGKSTLLRTLAQKLDLRIPGQYLLTREPGGSRVSEQIREILLREPMNPWTELLLYEAARAEHLHQVLLPALRSGKLVLCDRFTDSSLAYQGMARGLAWEKVRALNRMATQGLKPQLTVWMDIDPERGLQRASDPNRFENEGVTFQKKVRAGFQRARREEPKRFFVLRADSGTPEELAEKVLKKIARLKGWRSLQND